MNKLFNHIDPNEVKIGNSISRTILNNLFLIRMKVKNNLIRQLLGKTKIISAIIYHVVKGLFDPKLY